MKNKKLVIICVVLLLVIGVVSFFVIKNNKKIAEAKKTTVEVMNKFLGNGFTGYDHCLVDEVDIDNKMEVNIRKYYVLKEYTSLDDIKKLASEYETKDMIDKIKSDKFITNKNVFYCYVPDGEIALYNKDVEATSAKVKDNVITANVKFTKGSTTYKAKVEIVKENDSWKLSKLDYEE